MAEGTPAQLKAQIGRPTVEAIPADGATPEAIARILEQFGEPTGGSAKGVAVRLEHGVEDLAGIVRALDAEGIKLENLALHAPSLDDVFLAKTGRSLEGAAEEEEAEAEARGVSALAQVGYVARRSIVRTARQPANIIFPFVFPTALLAVTSAGLSPATKLPGFPSDSFLAFFLAFPFIQGALFATMNAGTDLARDIQTGFLNRLALTPLRGGALIVGQLGGIAVLAFVQNCYYLTVGLIAGVRLESGIVGGIVLIILATRSRDRVRRARRVLRAADRLGRGGAGPLPAPLRRALPLLDEPAAEPDRGRLVPDGRDLQPDLVPDRGAAQPDHHGLGLGGARRSRSASRRCSPARPWCLRTGRSS